VFVWAMEFRVLRYSGDNPFRMAMVWGLVSRDYEFRQRIAEMAVSERESRGKTMPSGARRVLAQLGPWRAAFLLSRWRHSGFIATILTDSLVSWPGSPRVNGNDRDLAEPTGLESDVRKWRNLNKNLCKNEPISAPDLINRWNSQVRV